MKKSLIAITLAVTAMTGCKSLSLFKTKVDGLYTVPSFTYQSVLDNSIAVGGVVYSAQQDENPALVQMQIQDFERELKDERPGYRVIPAVQLKHKMPADSYAQIMDEYQSSGNLSPASMKVLADHNYPRYVVFSNIIDDGISHERSEFEAKEKRNGVKVTVMKVKSETDRKVSAISHVFDLQAASLVWSGTVNKSDYESAYFVKMPQSQRVIAQLAQALTGDDKLYPYPAPSPLKDVMTRIYEGVAENLPAKPEVN